MTDTYRHKGMRKRLVRVLADKGIHHAAVLQAINEVPRHLFLDSAFEDLAYEDQALPIAAGQTISQPYTVAFQSQELDVFEGAKVLEIGTGSGYQACVLAKMGAKVYSIERQKELFVKTSALLKRIGFPMIRLFHKDGFEGLPQFAPFDRIIVTAGATEIPQALLSQLKVSGKLIIPYGNEDVQRMIRFTRESEQKYLKEEFDEFRFVPLLKGRVD